MSDERPVPKWGRWGMIGAAVYILFLIGVGGWGFLRPRSVDLDIIAGQTVHFYRFKDGPLTLTTMTLVDGDNGPAAIEVALDGRLLGTISSAFDYDLFNNQDPAVAHYAWVDGDLWPDLIIEPTNGGTRQVVLTISGDLVPCTGAC